MSEEPITIRLRRLNNLILGQPAPGSKILSASLSRECLLDALFLLYSEYSKDNIKKRNKYIAEFVAKYRSVISEAKILRLNIGDFSEKALIGEGYFGSVHLVKEKATGDLYAMKKIRKDINTLQVREEREIMSRRCSKWITNLQYSFQDSNFLYLVMEYLPGGDLLNLMIRNGPFEEDAVKFYMAEIILALNDLHIIGFAHRDVKPENILIDRFGHIKLADFGNAAVVNKNGSIFSLSPAGTPYYIAPELLRTITLTSKSVHDVTCDFWSVGIIAYEMIYETTPFYDENIQETYSKILKYCEVNSEVEKIIFPFNIQTSNNFKNLIENLLNTPSKRLTFSKIKKHKFFESTNWDLLQEQVPPYIPFLKSEDDISNFECTRKVQRKSTHLTKNIYANDFCGKDLQFLGYGFIYEEKFITDHNEASNEAQIGKFISKIRELEIIKKNQHEEITRLGNKLLCAEKKIQQSDLTEKTLHEAKEEIIRMKEMLKEKTVELVRSKTETKTLQNSLRIEEEHRMKSDASISEILNSTFKKWEKAKSISDQNYEKQIAEKKNEIINFCEKLRCYEKELASKIEELTELREQKNNYKKLLQNEQDKALVYKRELDKIKLNMQEMHDAKLNELKKKLEIEQDSNNTLKSELYETRHKVDEYIQLSDKNLQQKLVAEKKLNEIEGKLKKEVELNSNLSAEIIKIQHVKSEIDKAYENLFEEYEKLKQENCLREVSKYLNLGSGISSEYQSISGSLTELNQIETDKLKSDLAMAKEEEDRQRCKVDQLEKIVAKLECMLSEINERPKSLENLLEKQNEKLEDKLILIHEQVVVERQSARTANLSLWKTEKRAEELNADKKILQRRLELSESKVEQAQNQKRDVEMHVRELENFVKQKDARIEELKEKVNNLDLTLQEEHQSFHKAEKECIKLRHEILEQKQKTQNLSDKIKDLEQKILQMYSKNDFLILENRDLKKELNDERDRATYFLEQTNELEMNLKSSQENYKLLKIACSIIDRQLTDVEVLLNDEIKKNKINQEKIENFLKDGEEKAEVISKLKNDLNTETLKKLEAEDSIRSLELQCEKLKANVEYSKEQLISQKKQLNNITKDLQITQENLEITLVESNNIRTINKNFAMEIKIFKEENSNILTDLFLIKESNNKLNQELQMINQNICRLEEENQQLQNSLEEQKILRRHKDIKSEVTLMQYKKLINYLQFKLEDLSQKKKKSLADKFLAGISATDNKKGNLNSSVTSSKILFRTLQEEFNREKQKSKTDEKEIEKLKKAHESSNSEECKEKMLQFNQDIGSFCHLENIHHIFELYLNEDNRGLSCYACSSPILCGLPYWLCRECKFTIHKKCRSTLTTNCESFQYESIGLNMQKSFDYQNFQKGTDKTTDHFFQKICNNDGYVISSGIFNPPLEINSAYNLMPGYILLGTKSGLFVYSLTSDFMLKIAGIENVQSFSVSLVINKILFAANEGYELLQCDLTQLQNFVHLMTCNELEMKKIDVSNLAENCNKFYLTAISNIHTDDLVVVAGSSQVIIMKFDISTHCFEFLQCFKISAMVTSVSFMSHAIIISATKFLKIDLKSWAMEEFIDFSDPNLNHLQNYQSMNIFQINAEEYLICFIECGIFVDKYGRRSRPCEITWEYTPTNYLYLAPFLYISHFQVIQIIHLHEFYRRIENNDLENISSSVKRIYLNLYMPVLLGPSDNGSCFSLTRDRNTGKQHLILLNGFEAMKNQ